MSPPRLAPPRPAHTTPPDSDADTIPVPLEDSGGWRTQAELARAYTKTAEAHEQIGRLKERMRLLVEGSLDDTLPPGSKRHDVPCEPLRETAELAKSVSTKLNLLMGIAGTTLAIVLALVGWIVQRIDSVERSAAAAASQTARVVVLEALQSQRPP